MVGAGLMAPLAHEIAELYAVGERGLLRPRGDRTRRCAAPLETTLRRVLDQAQQGARSS